MAWLTAPITFFPMSPSTRARLQLIGAALLFSTGGAAIKAAAFTGWQIASLRSGFAAVALLPHKHIMHSRVTRPGPSVHGAGVAPSLVVIRCWVRCYTLSCTQTVRALTTSAVRHLRWVRKWHGPDLRPSRARRRDTGIVALTSGSGVVDSTYPTGQQPSRGATGAATVVSPQARVSHRVSGRSQRKWVRGE